MMFHPLNPRSLSVIGRAALLGLAALALPAGSAIGQDAPDREDSRRRPDEDRPGVVDLGDIEYTAAPRPVGESGRVRPEHRARAEGRRDGRGKGPAGAGESPDQAQAEMTHAQKALVRAAHRIVELEARMSGPHEGPGHSRPGERPMGARRGPGREEGRPEHRAEGVHGSNHERDRAAHREAGAHVEQIGQSKGEKAAHPLVKEYVEGAFKEDLQSVQGEIALAKAELTRAEDRLAWSTKMKEKGRITDSARLADELNRKRAKFDLERAQTKKDVLEKYTKEKTIKEIENGDRHGTAGGHADADARISQIEKKLDELIRVVHEMKARDGKEKGQEGKK